MRIYIRYLVLHIKNRTYATLLIFWMTIFITFRMFVVVWLIGLTGLILTGTFWFLTSLQDQYRCDFDGLKIFYCKAFYNKINYRKIQLLVISNSVVARRGQIKLGEKTRMNGKKKFIQYAHLTLFGRVEVVNDLDLAPGKQSTDLYIPNNQRFFPFLGSLYDSICWPDYLEELLTYVQTAPIYILEDVYERFKLDYDRIFSGAKNPIYIVTAPHTCRQYLRKSVI